MLHNLIDERYLEGPQNWSSFLYDPFNWVVIGNGDESSTFGRVDEMVQWCLKNCISKFSWGYKCRDHRSNYTEYGFIFQNIYDAMAFKLRWS